MSMRIRTYTELTQFKTFEERYEYLKLDGCIGVDTFGFDRVFNQIFYQSQEWKRVRNIVIVRDNGCDLGLEGYEIYGRIIIHHMNPISIDDIRDNTDFLLNPEFLICTIHQTHNAIHFGNIDLLSKAPIERRPNDTCPWK